MHFSANSSTKVAPRNLPLSFQQINKGPHSELPLFLVGKDTPSNNSKAGQQRCGRSKLSTTGGAHGGETTKLVL